MKNVKIIVALLVVSIMLPIITSCQNGLDNEPDENLALLEEHLELVGGMGETLESYQKDGSANIAISFSNTGKFFADIDKSIGREVMPLYVKNIYIGSSFTEAITKSDVDKQI